MNRNDLIELFVARYGEQPTLWAQAPGRVNLLGEHTDYNDGFVFPAAIDRYLSIAAAPRSDATVRAYSVDFEQESVFRLGDLRRSETEPWSNYLRGVFEQYQKRGFEVPGMDLVLSGNVPVGSGLSSSAALEVAVAETVRALAGWDIDRVQLALLSQAAEHQFIGVQCGIMDQFVSALAEAGTALFIDCRDLSYSAFRLSDEVSVVVCDSRVQRSLDSSAYNQRRSECEAAVAALRPALGPIRALRDVSPEELERYRDRIPEVAYRRARHVVREDERVLRGIELLEHGDVTSYGALLYESHASLRDDYEVSCRELDVLVELAREVPGTLGARMTGAGFGGCTVNLVRREDVEGFRRHVQAGYRERAGRDCAVYVCTASAGVRSEPI
ncbi:MAG: galactokinase [Acidobacteriota bacterium]